MSPTVAHPIATITKPAKRDANSICGYWPDATTSQFIWSSWCNAGEPCAIDTFTTPNIVFCSPSGYTPYTTVFGYGSWPRGGCGFRQTCCPSSLPKVATKVWDSGASQSVGCWPSDALDKLTLYTQYSGGRSIFLSPVARPFPTTEIPVTSANSPISGSPSPARSASSSAPTSTSTPAAPNKPGNNNSLKVGLGLGIPLGIILIAGAILLIFIFRRRAKSQKGPDRQHQEPIRTDFPEKILNNSVKRKPVGSAVPSDHRRTTGSTELSGQTVAIHPEIYATERINSIGPQDTASASSGVVHGASDSSPALSSSPPRERWASDTTSAEGYGNSLHSEIYSIQQQRRRVLEERRQLNEEYDRLMENEGRVMAMLQSRNPEGARRVEVP
ncbi:hypothetical protein K469DRAFT_749860 [Zopfia rhizophila CBS 207.26]|uniref:Mid2 domain-containing protein n=1 Tax=Zopfia rhizophila CBS 207.26 TaxID=1314779 RepID=A0A6A6E511_9PEZI|nr:hypothetical protein K469DRAFT_749860 [Zopfia rhizophila CBS 207.26]